MKVVPFIRTTGSEKYKKFITRSFTIDMLYPVFNEKSCDTLFDNWQGKNMIHWYRFTNDKKIVLEFYPNHYVIYKDVPNTVKYMLSIPKTINDFINDMERFGVELQWTAWIDQNFEPKDYMNKDEIEGYFRDLLGKMGKSHELQ